MSLDTMYSPKQKEVLSFSLHNDFFMLINHGAKRSGKTVVDNDIFLLELKRVSEIARSEGIKTPQYILAGADLSSIQRNVLTELSNKYGLDIRFDKANRFSLFGVKVCCFGHSKISDLGRIRGMTAYGAYINEATTANAQVFNEIKSRCSGTGARIIMDTNPDRPGHWLKKDYIDKADGHTIKDFHWRLTDNTFLSERYIESIKSSTPSGVFYDRDINGAWVAASGVVYPDFSREKHYITSDKVPYGRITKYFAGVDFGWEHAGAFVLIGKTQDGIYYLIREWSAKHRSIDKWIDIGKEIEKEYGKIYFYCDSARPDLIEAMQRARLYAMPARKDVTAGISAVATLFKMNRLYIVSDAVDLFDKEIDLYCWQEKSDAPVKEHDDVLDALRYGIFTEQSAAGSGHLNRIRGGL